MQPRQGRISLSTPYKTWKNQIVDCQILRFLCIFCVRVQNERSKFISSRAGRACDRRGSAILAGEFVAEDDMTATELTTELTVENRLIGPAQHFVDQVRVLFAEGLEETALWQRISDELRTLLAP